MRALLQRHAFEDTVRKSRFRAVAVPVASPEEALAALETLRDPKATHNCWAFRVGDQFRSSDDGEPGGTAGRPILAAIDGQGVDGVLVVVTRWFGGIKLGAGGLVRAYGGTAAECLRTAPVEEVEPRVRLAVTVPFDDAGAAWGVIRREGLTPVDETWEAAGPRLVLEVPAGGEERLRRLLTDATRGRGRVEPA